MLRATSTTVLPEAIITSASLSLWYNYWGQVNRSLPVLPYARDACYVPGSVKFGYEISFTRRFYKPQPLRPLEDIRADISALERETEGSLAEIVR